MWRRLLGLKNLIVDRRTRKGVVRVTLEAAFEQEHCPLCRLMLRQEERWLMVFLAESVLDLGIRRRILASWGFCRRHAWAMATRSDLGGPLATAIIYENLLDTLLQHCAVQQATGTAGPPLVIGLPERLGAVTPGRSCPACLARDRVERNYVISFNKYSSLPAFITAYQASDGFCPRHLAQVMAQARPAVRTLLLRQRIGRLQAPAAMPDQGPPRFLALPAELEQRLGRLVGPFPFYPGSIDAQRHATSVGSRVHSSALDQGGNCVVCQERRQVEQSLLTPILEVGEPGRLRWLCPEHAWMLYAVAWRSRAAAPFAGWLHDLLAVELAELELRLQSELAAGETARLRRLRPRPPEAESVSGHDCVVCAAQAEAVRRRAAKAVTSAHGALAGVCLAHAGPALQAALRENAGVLGRRLLERAWALRAELALYIRRVHWEYRHEAWEGERDSWWRAVRFFVGDE